MDSLTHVIDRLQVRARVFHTGALCESVAFDEGVGYIHMLRAGAMRLESPGRPGRLIDRPTLLFHARPLTHRLVPLEEGADLVCATLVFDGGRDHPIARTLPPVVVLPLHGDPAMSAVLQLLFAEAGAAASGRQALLDRLTEVVVIQLLRHLGNEGFVEHGALAALADPALGKALEAVHAQPAHPWTLEEVAAVAGMSRARFALRFRDVAGQTFGDYLADWRIGVAKSLLRKGLPVKTVAQEVGYANASALARVFVNKDQPTPRSWIRKARAEALAPVD